MANLHFTIAPPRAGKSTYCDIWVRSGDPLHPRAIVCADTIRSSMGHEYFAGNEHLVQAIKWTMIKALLGRGHDVIVDGTHSSENSLRNIFEIDCNAVPHWIPGYPLYRNEKDFDAFERKCVERGLATKGLYIVQPIRRIMSQVKTLATKYDPLLTDLRKKSGKPS